MSLNTDNLESCINTLESSLKMLNQSEAKSTEYEIFRNAVIKGFELTFEISGKLLKKALRPFFATSRETDRLTYKDIFRYAAKHDILTIEEVERWFEYRDNRNLTAHDYGEGFAEKTLILLPKLVLDAKRLMESLKNVEV